MMQNRHFTPLRVLRILAYTAVISGTISGIAIAQTSTQPTTKQPAATQTPVPAATAQPQPTTATAVFASGCFWCTESDFEKINGVLSARSGYIAGSKENPTYQEVSAGGTGHTEAVEVTYNPSVVSYAELLKVYWYSMDPLAKDAQFCDHGTQYRSALFYQNDAEKKAIADSKAQLIKDHPQLQDKIQTHILPTGHFWPAEDYHQDYYKKNPIRYKYYRYRCGRDQRVEALWGDKAHWAPAADTAVQTKMPAETQPKSPTK